MNSRFFAVASLLSVLFACEPVALTAAQDFPMETSVLVVSAKADDAQQLNGFDLRIDQAPPGDYLVFLADTAPTSVAALAGFDPDRDCIAARGACVAPGVGTYAGRSKLDATGRVDLERLGSASYLVVTYRGAVLATPLTVHVTARSTGGDGGCGGAASPPTLARVDTPK